MKHTIQKSSLEPLLQEAHDKFKSLSAGANANYIPFLANINSDLFGIALVLPTGEIYQAGDTDYVFGVESISKVHTAILAMKQSSDEKILRKIGADATGLPFNSIMAILLEKEHPSTPLVNAGAIAAVSMVEPQGDSLKKWKAITDNMAQLSGSPLVLLEELYESESQTNYNNRSIAWLLKNYDRIYDDPTLSLELYTRQCSMGTTTKQLAIVGATIAGGGRNPITNQQVFPEAYAQRIMSLMATVGFYEHTGDWMYTSGIPAKTGVGGGVMGSMPVGGFGIAAFSPPLDKAGNSVRAQGAIKYIVQNFGVSIFRGDTVEFV
ncbi:MAG: glutaminase A [Mucinivorans sp.]